MKRTDPTLHQRDRLLDDLRWTDVDDPDDDVDFGWDDDDDNYDDEVEE